MSMSTFTYGSISKSLNSGSVKPQAMAKLFGIELSSLSVLNLNTGDLHEVVDGWFDPQLPVSGNFEVNGERLVQANQPSWQPAGCAGPIVPRTSLSVAKRDQMIVDVIKEAQNMNDSTVMLNHAPLAVILMENLTILAACTRDPSLVSAEFPAGKFVRLRSPTSFKACLYQVASNISTAFRTADISMNKIHLALVDLPDYFQSTLEAVANPDDPGARETMQFTLQTIEDASNTCIKAAESSVTAFEGVILDIDELVESSQVSKTVNERRLDENKNTKREYEIQKEQRARDLAEQEQAYVERKERVEKALKDYNKEMEQMRDVGSLFAAAFADFLLDTLSSGKEMIADLSPSKLMKEVTKGIIGKTEQKHSPEFTMAAEASLIAILEKALAALDSPETLSAECDELIPALQIGVKFSGNTETGRSAANEAVTVIKFLQEAKKKPPTKEALANTKSSLSVLLNLLAETKRRMAEDLINKEKKGEQARMSILQVNQQRLTTAQSRYQQEDETAENLRKKLSQDRREMAELAGRLARLDLERVDLEDVVKYLIEGIMTLSRIKESWGNVVVFFHSINEVVGGPLKRNMSGFVEKAKSDNALTSSIMQKELLRLSLKSCGLCTQISACAQIYTAISRQHILPVINGVGQNLALSPEKAKQKRMQIEQRVTNAQDAVEKLVNEHIKMSKATVKAQLDEYAEIYSGALVRRN